MRKRDRTPKTYTRLTHPLVRDSRDEPLRRATWEEALDRTARGLAAARGAFGMFSCARATNEMNYVAQKFARVVMGTHNVDSCNRTCHAPSVAGLSAAFGSGGGTSSYEEIEHTDVIVMWGSNARFAHPIFFQHVLKGIRGGARMYAVDPRRTSTAEWAEGWLGPNVGTDIPLAHAVGREIIHAGLANEAFIARATTGYDEYKALVEPWTLSLAEKVTGVPAAAIRELAHAYARAERAQLCWTLGITEHHNGTDNVRALINLSLLTGHVGRYGSGLQPLRGQNNVQGGGDMGAIPNRLPGFQDVLDPEVRQKFETAWDTVVEPRHGLTLTEMFEAMEDGTLRAVYCIGENPAQSEADAQQAVRRLRAGLPGGPGHLPDEDRRTGRRGPPGDGRLGGDGGHHHQQRATRPRACAGRSARRGRPVRTSTSSATSRPAWATTGSTPTRRRSGTSCAPSPPTTTG
ncbi:Molybdopterin-dependent oxidoreductase OS=Streptomyces tendae OX=1932 GN=GUR47_01625 PE=4 SV=1 [Streptomyces tendae]